MAIASAPFILPSGWLDAHLTEELATAGPDDSFALGDITSDAFRHDPFNKWLFRDFRAMENTFHAMAKHVYAPRGLCHRIGDEACAMWMLPGGNMDLPAWAFPGIAATTLRYGGPKAVKRLLSFDKAVAPHHPTTPHAYLFTVGVRQGKQGKGLGKRLLAPVLTACDAIGLPAYLENSNPENRSFYQGLGFKRTALFEVLPGGAPLEGMWREAK